MSSVYHERNSRYVYLNTRGQWYVLDSRSVPIGFGAVGIVYPGYNLNTNSPVAIKMVRPEYSGIPYVRERARNEAQLTFLHPNIVRMLGLCEDNDKNGTIYLVSEYVNGLTFDSFFNKISSFYSHEARLSMILRHALSILEALEYVHTAGIIHRDVKPSNIMVTYDGTAKLMDLGIAGIINSDLQSNHEFMGTALYASPELIKGSDIDKRADLYALGVTLFEVITGYNPFSASTQDEILSLHLTTRLPEDDSIPKDLYSILCHSTEKRKSKRYQSARLFANDLKEFLYEYAPDPV